MANRAPVPRVNYTSGVSESDGYDENGNTVWRGWCSPVICGMTPYPGMFCGKDKILELHFLPPGWRMGLGYDKHPGWCVHVHEVQENPQEKSPQENASQDVEMT